MTEREKELLIDKFARTVDNQEIYIFVSENEAEDNVEYYSYGNDVDRSYLISQALSFIFSECQNDEDKEAIALQLIKDIVDYTGVNIKDID